MYYYVICDWFQITYQTELGQTLDLLTAPQDRVDFTTYTMERFCAIVSPHGPLIMFRAK